MEKIKKLRNSLKHYKVDGFLIPKNDEFFKLEGIDDISVSVKKAEGEKCSRCWKILKTPCARINCGLKN